MVVSVSARDALRTATADDHARVDRLFGRLRLDRRDEYVGFLRAQAMAYLPAEAAVERAAPTALLPDWPERRRAALLRDDLDRLGVTRPAEGRAPSLASPAAVLGAVYVLEGSRLGGRLLARSVPAHFPRRFLTAGEPRLWRALVAALDENLADPADRAKAVAAAREVFALFELGASACQGSVH